MLRIFKIFFSIFLVGKAYQHIRWGGPYRDIFYDPQHFASWLSSLTGETVWEIYNNHSYEHFLNFFSDFIGLTFIALLIVIWLPKVFKKIVNFLTWMSTVLLFLNFFGLFYGKHFSQIGIFIEHSSQLIFPFMYLWAVSGNMKKVYVGGAIAISLTFLGHGLYALGYHPQPGKFVDMIILSLGTSETFARSSLVVVGWLDVIFALWVLIPLFKKTFATHWSLKFWLVYGLVWGLLTSVARMVFSFETTEFFLWLDQYTWMVLVRVPHFFIPLILIYFSRIGYPKWSSAKPHSALRS